MIRNASLSEMRTIEYRILCFFDKVCRENSIEYYLAYGTLIGAVRHKGYIPWDDDIDVMMFRNDYNRFAKVMEGCKDSPYKLLSIDNDNVYTFPFPKLCDTRTTLRREKYRSCPSFGIYIDIFILDNVPDNIKKRRSFVKNFDRLRCLWECSQTKDVKNKKKTLRTMIKFLIRRISPRTYSKLINKYAQMYNKKTTSYCGQLLLHQRGYEKDVYLKSMFGKGTRLQFETGIFPAPEDYDGCLSNCYGDYMKLPPIEERIPKHDVNALFDDALLENIE